MATSDSVSAALKTVAADGATDGSVQLQSRRRRDCFHIVTGELADALGVASLASAPGCWDRKVDAHWSVSVNAHATEMQSKLLDLPVPPGHVVVKYNGWLAGLVDAFGAGQFGLGGGANEDAFIAAVRTAIREIERESNEKKSAAAAATSSATAVAFSPDDEKKRMATAAVGKNTAVSSALDFEGLWRTRIAEGEVVEAVRCGQGLPYDGDEWMVVATTTTTDACPCPHTYRIERRPCLGAACVARVCCVCVNRPVSSPSYCSAKCRPVCTHERRPCQGPGCRATACIDCDVSRYCSWRCGDNAFDAVA